MSAAGELPPLDCAIFADTGSEPQAVYRHLEWLIGVLPFPVHQVRAWEGYGKPSIKGPLGAEILAATTGDSKAGAHSRPPFFVKNGNGKRGMLHRQCTGDYKVDVINKKVRELLGLRPRQRWPKVVVVEQWMGISTDEATRMKPSNQSAIRTRWPLIEAGMSRRGCLRWLSERGYPTPPKSACTFCPFHDDAAWRNLRDNDAAGWAEAVEIDRAIRHGLKGHGLDGELYLHDSLVPLEVVDLDSGKRQVNPLENECEGVCGV